MLRPFHLYRVVLYFILRSLFSEQHHRIGHHTFLLVNRASDFRRARAHKPSNGWDQQGGATYPQFIRNLRYAKPYEVSLPFNTERSKSA